MKKDDFRCVECNEEASELHRDYRNGILKITICVRSVLSLCSRVSECVLCCAIANMICPPGANCYVDAACHCYFSKINLLTICGLLHASVLHDLDYSKH